MDFGMHGYSNSTIDKESWVKVMNGIQRHNYVIRGLIVERDTTDSKWYLSPGECVIRGIRYILDERMEVQAPPNSYSEMGYLVARPYGTELNVYFDSEYSVFDSHELLILGVALFKNWLPGFVGYDGGASAVSIPRCLPDGFTHFGNAEMNHMKGEALLDVGDKQTAFYANEGKTKLTVPRNIDTLDSNQFKISVPWMGSGLGQSVQPRLHSTQAYEWEPGVYGATFCERRFFKPTSRPRQSSDGQLFDMRFEGRLDNSKHTDLERYLASNPHESKNLELRVRVPNFYGHHHTTHAVVSLGEDIRTCPVVPYEKDPIWKDNPDFRIITPFDMTKLPYSNAAIRVEFVWGFEEG